MTQASSTCNVLTAEDLLNLFASATFQNLLSLIQKPLLDKVDKLEEKNNELINRIKQLENTTQILSEKIRKTTNTTTTNQTTVYAQQQIEKRSNLIISGIPEEENDDIKKKLTQIFQEKFNRSETKFDCERIGKSIENQPIESQPTPKKSRAIRVRFYNIWDRRSIFTNRIKSLQSTGIFINEDLMADKAKLAFEARKLKRQKIIYSTYTQEGQVFFKENENSEAKEFNEAILNEILTNILKTQENGKGRENDTKN